MFRTEQLSFPSFLRKQEASRTGCRIESGMTKRMSFLRKQESMHLLSHLPASNFRLFESSRLFMRWIPDRVGDDKLVMATPCHSPANRNRLLSFLRKQESMIVIPVKTGIQYY